MDKIKVLTIAPTPFFSHRGCHVRILEEIMASSNKIDFIIVTYHIGDTINNLKIERIKNINWYKKISAGPSIFKIYLDTLLLFKCIEIIKKYKPDIIHSHLHEGLVIGTILSKLFKLPHISDLQGSLKEELEYHNFIKNKILLNLIHNLEKYLTTFPDFIILSSYNLKEILNLDASNWLVIEDTVSPEIFYKTDKPDLNLPFMKKLIKIKKQKIKLIGHLGVLSAYQGTNFLIKFCYKFKNLLKNYHFVLIGYPAKKYKKMIQYLNLTEYFTVIEGVRYFQAKDYLSVLDAGLAIKLSRTESNGKVLTYMACKLPVITIKSEFTQKTLANSGIFLNLPLNFNDFYSSLKHINNKDDMQNLSLTAYNRYITHFLPKNTGSKLLKLYKALTKQR